MPGIIGWWLLEVVDGEEVGSWEVDDERGRFRLRKDIWCLYGKGSIGVLGWKGRLYFIFRASAIDYVISNYLIIYIPSMCPFAPLTFSLNFCQIGSCKQSISIYELRLHIFAH